MNKKKASFYLNNAKQQLRLLEKKHLLQLREFQQQLNI